MKITYDKIADALYLTLSEAMIDSTVKMNDRLIVDMDKAKNAVGIEILNASAWQNVQGLEENVRHGIPVEITAKTSAVS